MSNQTLKSEIINILEETENLDLLKEIKAILNASSEEAQPRESRGSIDSVLSEDETQLLKIINNAVDTESSRIYKELTQKSLSLSLNPEEIETLLEKTKEIEKANNDRLKALIELSKLWDSDLPSLMTKLGIEPAAPLYAE